MLCSLVWMDLCDSLCKDEAEAEEKPERTSTEGPGLLSERKSELPSHLHFAGKHLVSPFLCHTCGTTAARKILCLKDKKNHIWIPWTVLALFERGPLSALYKNTAESLTRWVQRWKHCSFLASSVSRRWRQVEVVTRRCAGGVIALRSCVRVVSISLMSDPLRITGCLLLPVTAPILKVTQICTTLLHFNLIWGH